MRVFFNFYAFDLLLAHFYFRLLIYVFHQAGAVKISDYFKSIDRNILFT